MTNIPAPTDTRAPEYDAPPPGPPVGAGRFLSSTEMLRVVQRPASRIVNNPSEKPRVIVRG